MARAKKSAAAFRTISEVADVLEVPQHVLRFWETKFPQIKPLKRGGGRRYYRPDDVDLLRRIQHLLYEEGYTIKGVQKLLKENKGKIQTVLSDDVPTEDLLDPDVPVNTVSEARDSVVAPVQKTADGTAKKDETATTPAVPPAPDLSSSQKQQLRHILSELQSIRRDISGL